MLVRATATRERRAATNDTTATNAMRYTNATVSLTSPRGSGGGCGGPVVEPARPYRLRPIDVGALRSAATSRILELAQEPIQRARAHVRVPCAEKVADAKLTREGGFLYFIDKDGDDSSCLL